MDLLANKFDGKARHSDLMNMSHMKKREFGECVASLIEREAVRVEAVRSSQGNIGKTYILSPKIMESWSK